MSTRKDLALNRVSQSLIGAGAPFVIRDLTKSIKSPDSKFNTQGVLGLAWIAATIANQLYGKRLAQKYVAEHGVDKGAIARLAKMAPHEPTKAINPLTHASELIRLYRDRKLTKTAAKKVSVVPIKDLLKAVRWQVPENVGMAGFAGQTDAFEKAIKLKTMMIPEKEKAKATAFFKNQGVQEMIKNPPSALNMPDKVRRNLGYGHPLVVHMDMADHSPIAKSRAINEVVTPIKHPLLGKSRLLSKIVAGVQSQPSLARKPIDAALSLGQFSVQHPLRLASELSFLTGAAWAVSKMMGKKKTKDPWEQNADIKAVDQPQA
jgi:hypothetical protein